MKRKPIVFGVIVLVLAAAALFIWQRTSSTTTAPAAATQTVAVSRGSLVATVSASGNVTATQMAALAFTTEAEVATVSVKVGDVVTKGRMVMAQDLTTYKLAVKTAETTLASQQASYDETQADLEFAVRTAQASLNSAQASYDSAKASTGTNKDQLIVAAAAVETARVALQTAQSAYDVVAWRPDIGMTTQASTLQTATTDYNSAMATYRITAAGINDTSLRTSKATLDQAQVTLDQANKNLDTSLRTAKASLDNAQTAVDTAKRDLENATLYAPFDGTVATVNYAVGDYADGTALTVVDLTSLQVKVTVAEVDMSKIKVGAKAKITLDALTGKVYTATVTAIGPVGTVTSGVVNYPVYLGIDNADANLKPGMTATLDIEVERRDNVLLVPARAVRTSNNQKVVSVMRDGKAVTTKVTVGLSNDASYEIMDGLNEGDVVTISGTKTSAGGGGGGGMMMGGGPGGPP